MDYNSLIGFYKIPCAAKTHNIMMFFINIILFFHITILHKYIHVQININRNFCDLYSKRPANKSQVSKLRFHQIFAIAK